MGLYAIYNEANRCMYLGKSKDLYTRLKTHYRESVSDVEVHPRFDEFFKNQDNYINKEEKNQHTGKPWVVKIYYLPVQLDKEREEMEERKKMKKLKGKDIPRYRKHSYKAETLRIVLERIITRSMLSEKDPPQPLFEYMHSSIK